MSCVQNSNFLKYLRTLNQGFLQHFWQKTFIRTGSVYYSDKTQVQGLQGFYCQAFERSEDHAQEFLRQNLGDSIVALQDRHEARGGRQNADLPGEDEKGITILDWFFHVLFSTHEHVSTSHMYSTYRG